MSSLGSIHFPQAVTVDAAVVADNCPVGRLPCCIAIPRHQPSMLGLTIPSLSKPGGPTHVTRGYCTRSALFFPSRRRAVPISIDNVQGKRMLLPNPLAASTAASGNPAVHAASKPTWLCPVPSSKARPGIQAVHASSWSASLRMRPQATRTHCHALCCQSRRSVVRKSSDS